jgi:hypothetical protein
VGHVEADGVVAGVGLHADAVEPVAGDLEIERAVVAEVDLEPVAGAESERVGVGRSGHDERPVLEPGAAGRRGFHELALAVLRHGPARVPADPLGEGGRQPGVGAVGDEQQVAVERHGAAEPALAGDRVGEQAVAQRLGCDVGDVELDRVRVRIGRGQAVEREHGLLQEAAADRLRDVVQLVVVDAVDVEAAGALERRGPEVRREEDSVE